VVTRNRVENIITTRILLQIAAPYAQSYIPRDSSAEGYSSFRITGSSERNVRVCRSTRASID